MGMALFLFQEKLQAKHQGSWRHRELKVLAEAQTGVQNITGVNRLVSFANDDWAPEALPSRQSQADRVQALARGSGPRSPCSRGPSGPTIAKPASLGSPSCLCSCFLSCRCFRRGRSAFGPFASSLFCFSVGLQEGSFKGCQTLVSQLRVLTRRKDLPLPGLQHWRDAVLACSLWSPIVP